MNIRAYRTGHTAVLTATPISAVAAAVASAPERDRHSLRLHALHGLKWSYLGVSARVAAQFVAQIALARMLGPEVFGVVAAGVLVMTLGGIVAELGLGAALVQRPDLTPDDVAFALGRALVGGALTSAVLFLCAPLIALPFDDRSVTTVVRGLAGALFLQSVGVVPLALLRRRMDFKAIQVAQLLGYVSGFLVIGVALAWAGAGLWSMVAAWWIQNAVSATVVSACVGRLPRPRWKRPVRGSSGFGRSVMLTNLSNWGIENIDNLLIGRAFGTGALGLYALAYSFVRTPTNHAVVSLQSVLFPATARAQETAASVSRGYLAACNAIAVLTFPAFWGVAAVATTAVEAFFGQAWQSAGRLLLPLALAMPFHAVMALAGPVLWGRGRPAAELQVQLAVCVTLTASLLVAAQISLEAMAWTVAGVYVVRAGWMTVRVMRDLSASWGGLYRALLGGMVLGIISTIAAATAEALVGVNSAPALRLSAAIFAAASATVIACSVMRRLVWTAEFASIVGPLASRLPAPARVLFLAIGPTSPDRHDA